MCKLHVKNNLNNLYNATMQNITHILPQMFHLYCMKTRKVFITMNYWKIAWKILFSLRFIIIRLKVMT